MRKGDIMNKHKRDDFMGLEKISITNISQVFFVMAMTLFLIALGYHYGL